jgi:hypothetical protein
MARYFFHVIDGHEMLDTEGTVLAGEAEARAEAIVLSGSMLKESATTFWNNGQWQGLRPYLFGRPLVKPPPYSN